MQTCLFWGFLGGVVLGCCCFWVVFFVCSFHEHHQYYYYHECCSNWMLNVCDLLGANQSVHKDKAHHMNTIYMCALYIFRISIICLFLLHLSVFILPILFHYHCLYCDIFVAFCNVLLWLCTLYTDLYFIFKRVCTTLLSIYNTF